MRRGFQGCCGAVLLSALLGCAQCQDCNDTLGPVPDSPNYGTYDLGDRSGSAFAGGAATVETAHVISEETADEASDGGAVENLPAPEVE